MKDDLSGFRDIPCNVGGVTVGDLLTFGVLIRLRRHRGYRFTPAEVKTAGLVALRNRMHTFSLFAGSGDGYSVVDAVHHAAAGLTGQ